MADSHRGARIGTKIAVIISRALIATHQGLVTTKHKLAMLVFRAISDEISEEVDHTLGPILQALHENYPEDGPARGLVEFMATNHGQLKAITGSAAASQGLLWVISAILNNELAPLVYDTLRHSPFSLPDPGSIAQSVAMGTTDYSEGINDIAAYGFNAGWGDSLIALSQNWPTVSTIQDIRNRGWITEDEAVIYLKRAGIPDQALQLVLDTRTPILSPADLALAVLRGTMDMQEGIDIAGQTGYNPDQFQVLIDNTGEPLGLEQLLEAFRRGFIDEATLKRGILQSRVRDEWISTAIQLRYSPMSVADAVNAVVQNHMSQTDGEAIAQQNGLEPGAFGTLYETAGEPLSRTEMEDLYNRGLASESDVDEALRESRLKDKYVNQAFALHVRLLEPRMLSSAVEMGSVTHADAIKIALEYGYDQATAEILVGEGSNRKLQTYRAAVVTATEALYEENAISLDDAVAIAKEMGFEGTEASFIFEAAEFKRQAKGVTTAISAIRSKYIGRHITESEASAYLDALGVPSAQRDYLLGLWKIEHAANVRTLTEAQIVKAVGSNLITPQDGLARLEAMGYNATDAGLLLGGA